MSAELSEIRALGSTASRLSKNETFGILRLGAVQVCMPLSAMREVIPCPEQFEPLPSPAAGLLGAIQLRGLIVPVIDIRQRLGIEAEERERQVVVVVSDNSRVLAILADDLDTLVQVPSSAIIAMASGGTDLFMTHCFRHPVNGVVVSVLDVEALLNLADVPTAQISAAEVDATKARKSIGDSAGKFTLLQCGRYSLALGVTYAHTTLPSAPLSNSILNSELCLGVREYLGQDVAVLDPLQLLGLADPPSQEQIQGPCMVLKLPTGYVMLALGTVNDIADFPAASILALPPFTMRHPELVTGMVGKGEWPDTFIIDGAALLAHTELLALAAMNTPHVGHSSEASHSLAEKIEETAAATDHQVEVDADQLVYSIGMDLVTPLSQVSEILPYPSEMTPTDAADFMIGVISHREGAIPIVILTTLLGLPAAPITITSCVLIVELAAGRIGFVVEGLRGIAKLAWKDPVAKDQGSVGNVSMGNALRSSPLTRLHDDQRLLSQLDLLSLARGIHELAGGPSTQTTWQIEDDAAA